MPDEKKQLITPEIAKVLEQRRRDIATGEAGLVSQEDVLKNAAAKNAARKKMPPKPV